MKHFVSVPIVLMVSALLACAFPTWCAAKQRHRPSAGKSKTDELPGIIATISKSVVVVTGETSTGGRELGTGFCVHSGGYLVTALHVVSGGDIKVGVLRKGYYYALPGTLVAQDKTTDTAIVRVDADLPPLTIMSELISAGERIAILGFPFGPQIDRNLVLSASAGIVSAVRPPSDGQPAHQVIQLDVAVDHGDSGGPVFIQSRPAIAGMVTTTITLDDKGEKQLATHIGLASSAAAITKLLATIQFTKHK